jgi:hypothetical protein
MNETLRLLERLQRERFYGALEIKFENGHVVVLKKSETILPTKSRESGPTQNVTTKP